MKHHTILTALLLAAVCINASAKSADLPHGHHCHSHGHSYSHHGGGHYAYHYAFHYHYHPHYYGHSYGDNCEKRYDRCIRRHPNHPRRCRECR